MIIRRIVILILLSTLGIINNAQDDMPVDSIPVEPQISGAWVRATVIGDDGIQMDDMFMEGQTAAAYMEINNITDENLRFVGATTPAAEFVEMHETTMEDDIMSMVPLPDGLLIGTGNATTLGPTGRHLMLINLTRDLVLGQAIMLNLTFAHVDEDGKATEETFDIVIGVPVLEAAPEAIEFAVAMAWSRPTVSMDATEDELAEVTSGPSAIYMHLTNNSDEDDILIGAETNIAGIVEIHETSIQDDIMRMNPLADGLQIRSGATAVLEPGSYHIMLLDLQENLVPGEAFILTLIFESGAKVPVAVPVFERDTQMLMDMQMGG